MSNHSITIRGLKKSFGKGANKNEVLKGIDLNVTPGQIVGYIGPNGAGKSTTVKILCGIIKSYQGEIEVMGMPLESNTMVIKEKIGYVPENGTLYEVLTPREYLNLLATLYNIDPTLSKERIEQLLKYFKMDKHIDQRMDTFSKGMKQKILIISGLLNNPDILFLDEPLNGLDANSVIQVKELLTDMAKQGKTIFYSSHLMDVVEKISNRIILINNGVVVADGTFDELKTDSGATLEQLFAQLTDNGEHSSEKEYVSEILKG